MEKRIEKIGTLVVFGIFVSMLLMPTVLALDDDYTEVQATGSVIVWIDKDGDSGSQIFNVIHDDSETELFRIQQNGNVGIGTTNPDNLLDIEKQGTVKSNLDIFHITNSANAADMDGTETSILFNQYYYHASPVKVDIGRITVGTEDDWTQVVSTQDGYMAFHTVEDGTVSEKVRITSDGSVGIGETDPSAKLEVVDSSNPQLRLTNTDTYYTELQTTGSGYLFVNPSGGKVGIGTNSPGATLHVGTREGELHSAGSIDRIAIASYSYLESWVIEARDTPSQSNMDLRFGSNTLLTVKGSGYVGIGTTYPTALFHFVKEGEYPQNDCLRVWDEANDQTPFHIDHEGNVGIGVNINYNNKLDVEGSVAIGSAYAGTSYYSAPADGLIVEGDVGIGTPSPITTLDVNGGLATNIDTRDHTDDGYTPTTSDYTILVDADSATEDVDINLPAASSRNGQILVIKRIDDNPTYDVVINRVGSDLIDGATSKTLDTQWKSLTIQSNGSNWFILASQP